MKLQKEVEIVKSILNKISFIKSTELFSNSSAGCILKTTLTDGYQVNLVIEFLKNGYPSNIKNVLSDLQKEKWYTVIAAPYLTESAMEICKKEKIGFIDYAGNCFIDYNFLHISISGNKNLNVKKRAIKSVFEKSSIVSSNILRLLLRDMNKQWKLQEISLTLGCSIGQVYKVKDFLMKNSWIDYSSKRGLKIIDPKSIFNEWAQVYGSKKEETVECYSLDNQAEIEKKLSKIKNIKYFLTGFSGGARYSSSVRYNKVHVYIQPDQIDYVIEQLGCKRVESGANLSIIIPYDDCVTVDSRVIGEYRVVSPVQVYLDCMQLKGRGEELADAVFLKEINNSERQ